MPEHVTIPVPDRPTAYVRWCLNPDHETWTPVEVNLTDDGTWGKVDVNALIDSTRPLLPAGSGAPAPIQRRRRTTGSSGGRPRKYADDVYSSVAEEYQALLDDPAEPRPLVTLAARRAVTYRVAAHLVAGARARGFLK